MEERPNIWKTGFSNGLIIGFVIVIYSFLLYLLELNENQFLGLFSYVILLLGIVWVHQNYKKNGVGFMRFGEGLGLGMVVSGVSGIMAGIFAILLLKVIDPNMIERITQKQVIELQDQGMSQTQIDQTLKVMEFMQSPVLLLAMTIVGYLLFGFIISLIVSAITKKNNPAPSI